jgi:hypothetical protein
MDWIVPVYQARGFEETGIQGKSGKFVLGPKTTEIGICVVTDLFVDTNTGCAGQKQLCKNFACSGYNCVGWRTNFGARYTGSLAGQPAYRVGLDLSLRGKASAAFDIRVGD